MTERLKTMSNQLFILHINLFDSRGKKREWSLKAGQDLDDLEMVGGKNGNC